MEAGDQFAGSGCHLPRCHPLSLALLLRTRVSNVPTLSRWADLPPCLRWYPDRSSGRSLLRSTVSIALAGPSSMNGTYDQRKPPRSP
eukprot:8966714-Heterocapsa_arctica.AAC.1